MPKKLIQRFIPDPNKIKQHKHLKIFGDLLHDQNLWHLNRRSAAGAFAVGLFMMWIPVPFQMILGAGAAILFRVNLPLSAALVWISNPLTMPPMFYFAYLVGAGVLGHQVQNIEFEVSIRWALSVIDTVGLPFLVGCLICGVISSIIGYVGIRILWRFHVVSSWKKRRLGKR